METIEKLNYFFGVIGMASIVAWGCAILLVLAFAVRLRSTAICWVALGLAIGGLVLANVNSHYVSEIKTDFSKELKEAEQRARKEAEEEQPELESDISDEARKAGQDEAITPPTDGDEGQPADEKPAYSYRDRGPQARDEGKIDETETAISENIQKEAEKDTARYMETHDVEHANRIDKLNLLVARSTLYMAILLVVVDYFRRFNTTYWCYSPVPFGGRLVDTLFKKTHTVTDANGGRDWKRFLERTVRKGENFVLFSTGNPWKGEHLQRLSLSTRCLMIWVTGTLIIGAGTCLGIYVGLTAFHAASNWAVLGGAGSIVTGVVIGLIVGGLCNLLGTYLLRLLWKLLASWRVGNVSSKDDESRFDDEFLFESAWYGRYCFVVEGDSANAVRRLENIVDALEMRKDSRASSRRTLNLVWSLSTSIPTETLDRLLPLCERTNIKLIVAQPEPDPQLGTQFEEVCLAG